MPITAKRRKPLERDPLHKPYDARILRKAEATAERYQIVLWREDGQWFGRGLEIPGCMGDGKTIPACVRVTRRSLVLGVASLLEHGQDVPVPQIDQERRPRRRAG